jgi:hypothetical protein
MILSTNPSARPLTRVEQDDFNTTFGKRRALGEYKVAPDVGQTNWGSFPLVRIQNCATGRAFVYYRHPPGHPRYWVNQFFEALGQ